MRKISAGFPSLESNSFAFWKIIDRLDRCHCLISGFAAEDLIGECSTVAGGVEMKCEVE